MDYIVSVVQITPQRYTMMAVAPIDENYTQVYLRQYQNQVRLPVLRNIVT
ncbi:MAG: hypothetical protein ACHBN1_13715 [Heteroscytonema crispum UTEX LB 1556]